MMPFEAGVGTGMESVLGTGKEARSHQPQLIVVVGLDEAGEAAPADFDAQVRRLRTIESQAKAKGVAIAFSVWDYPVQFSDFELEDVIVPSGRSRPQFDFLSYFDGNRNQSTGVVTDTAAQWLSRISEIQTGNLDRRSRVVFVLDDSGSMQHPEWLADDVPRDTRLALRRAHAGITVTTKFRIDEQWLDWFRIEWDDYVLDNP